MERPSGYQPEQTKWPYTDEERIWRAVGLLEEGFDRITNSEQFQEYLKTAATFPDHSPNDIMMIFMQKPDATRIADQRAWQKLGRQVRPGEPGIHIFAPLVTRVQEETDDGQKQTVEVLRGIRLVNVFDISETEGESLPVPENPNPPERPHERGVWLFNQASGMVRDQGGSVGFEDLIDTFPSRQGYYRTSDRHIGLEQTMMSDQRAKALVHEITHMVVLDAGGPQGSEKDDTVAEGTAFVVLNHFGIDSANYSFPFVSNWAKDREALKSTISLIGAASNYIIGDIGLRSASQAAQVYDQDAITHHGKFARTNLKHNL